LSDSKCPLCGREAKTWREPISRNTCVECPSCGHYQTTPLATKYYFEVDLLAVEAKQKLIAHLLTLGAIRIINADMIRKVTGIESI
jgi:hypothetical protein